ncbi:hypothetical protein A9239_03970 [Methanosarcina sp. A14]|nr:hypothetical protein A9239_03970 [Methanosarcina sp. A14]
MLNWIQGKKKRPSNGVISKKKPKTESSQKGSIKRPGGQKRNPGSTLNKVEDPYEIICYQPHECKYCGHKIEESEIIGYETQ